MSSSSPPEDKIRTTNRGQKRNFSFESHPAAASSRTSATAGKDVTSSASLFMHGDDDGGRFDIAAIVAKMDIGGIGGITHPGNIAEESTSDQFEDTEKDEFSTTNESSNNTDSSTGESLLHRASYIQFQTSSEDMKSFSPVDLQVSNLDQTIDQREMKKVLVSIFSEHVNVLNVSVFFQSDGNMAASVRVGSPQEAQVAIAQLHRKKLGFKRILISNNHVNNFNPNMLRSKVGALLAEVPNGRLQLFKFREMYEKRYHDSIGVSDLYKMKDVVNISEDQSGRMIQLQPNWYSVASQHQRMPNMAIDFQTVNANIFAPSRRQESLLGSAVVGAPQPGLQTQSAVVNSCPPILDSAFCKIHCSDVGENKIGWAEKENGTLLPNVNASLQILGPNVKNLIQTHGGALPLASLAVCYAAVYPPGFQVDNQEGVPLEHLVSCVRGVAIQQSVSGIKQLVLVGITPPHQGFIGTTFTGRTEEGKISSVFTHYRQLSGSASSASSSASSSLTNLTNFGLSNQVCPQQPTAAAPLAGQLALFSRELVDLLKTSHGCRMPFSKFIPAYHHHFGRQCRVADYGYTKLKELFEALPHVVQIMGEGSKALITLAHRAQVKRFTNDLLKVLKAQPSKQISILDLPLCFEKSLTRHFKISDYGVCDMEDILHEVSETTVVLCGSGDDMMISIPKREQTQSEMERTHQFAQECIELLRHAPDCRLNFNKFIPAYHHHFGRQCRVSDYGFSKLIELFEAIPTTVEITEDADGERLLQLTDPERLAVLGDQITSLVVHSSSNSVNINNNNNNIKSSNKQSLKLEDLEEAYINQFGYQLRPDTYGESTIVDLLGKLNQSLRVEKDETGSYQVRLIDRSYIKALANQVRDILATDPEGNLTVIEFSKAFQERHYVVPDLVQMRSDLVDWVEFYEVEEGDDAPLIDLNDDAKDISEDSSNGSSSTSEVDESRSREPVVGKKKVEYIRLKPLQLCVVKIQNLLKDYQDEILMSEFEAAFAEKYENALCPGQYGYPSLLALIQSPVMVEEHFLIRGRGARKMIWFMRDGVGSAFNIANLPLPTPTGRGLIHEQNGQNYSFQDRVTSAINSFTAQNRYPGTRQDPIRFGQASNILGSGRNWANPAPIGRSTAPPQMGSYTRSIRGAQQPIQQSQMQPANNRNRFVYPPPVQNQLFNYPMALMQQQQQPDVGSSYWGNLAQFGLFPNGRGGVAPVGAGVGHIGQVEHTAVRPQNMAVGSSVCGRGLGGSLVPPPPLQRLSPCIGSPIQQGISSLLPTPHSPSPMMSAGTSPFMFPPTYWPSNNNMASSPGSYAFK